MLGASVCLFAPGLMLHATSSRSDSSGFVEESAPGRTPMAQLTDAPLPPGQAV